MPDPIIRLNAALQGRYRIEREIGEGGDATKLFMLARGLDFAQAIRELAA